MKPVFVAPKRLLDKKPPHGSPCNGCGLCCMAMLCDLAMHVFALPQLGRCPALVQTSEDTFACGLTLIGTAEKRKAALTLIGSGDGCDARFNGEPRNEEFYKTLDAKDDSSEMRKAREIWGM